MFSDYVPFKLPEFATNRDCQREFFFLLKSTTNTVKENSKLKILLCNHSTLKYSYCLFRHNEITKMI